MAKANKDLLNLNAPKGRSYQTALKRFDSLKQKVQQVAQNAIAVILKNRANNKYLYGEFDNLPNVIITAVDNSGTATACVNRLAQFIQADGFIGEGMDNIQANSRQKLTAILGEQAQNVAYFQGYALRLVFNVEGNIAKIFNLDIKTLRRVGKGFEFNPLMGEVGKDETETRHIPEFDPERTPQERRALIAEQIKRYGEQVGEVLYIFKKGMGRYYDIYPIPPYYSAIEDIISDGKISQLDLRNISQGFRTPVVISTGPIDDQNEDEDGKTAQDYFDEALEGFTGEDASPILHLKGATEEFKPTITVIDLAEILDQTEKTSERIAKRVARIIGVPDVLIGMETSGKLGNVQELKNQMALFALSLYRMQQLIKEGYDLIKPLLALKGMENVQELDFTISTLKPFDFLPESVINNLTSEEQKELFELEFESDVSKVEAEQVQLNTNDTFTNLTGRQMQNIQRIIRKFNKDELTFEQASQMLKAGFGMSDEEVNVWLVTKEEEEAFNNLIQNSYTDYPKEATENAKIALRYAEENGWGSCGTDVGKARANQLAKGEAISEETISRMASFERHRQNSDKELGDGCGRLMWLAWGGDAGIEWAQRKLEQIKREKE